MVAQHLGDFVSRGTKHPFCDRREWNGCADGGYTLGDGWNCINQGSKLSGCIGVYYEPNLSACKPKRVLSLEDIDGLRETLKCHISTNRLGASENWA